MVTTQALVLGADFMQILVELEPGVFVLVLLPAKEKFLLGADAPVLQPLGIIARVQKLHRNEEPSVKLRVIGRVLSPS